VGQVTVRPKWILSARSSLGIGEALADLIEKKTGFETRSVNLGHTQRVVYRPPTIVYSVSVMACMAIDMVHQKKWAGLRF